MDRGRILLLLDLLAGLEDGELFIGFDGAACSLSEGVVADDAVDAGSVAPSRSGGGEGVGTEPGLQSGFGWDFWKVSVWGDDAGVGVLESR